MNVRENTRWSLLVPTSIGIRITPDDGQPVHTATRFTMQVTSAETNVASIPAYLGLPTAVMTAFVEGSPISAMAKASLRARGMDVLGPDKPQGGPWGYRHQFNIADSGYGNRAPRVWNDRAGEVGRDISVDDFDFEDIFGRQGVGIVEMSGLFAALSENTSRFCVELAHAAKAHGTLVAMDMNYRASFWKGREVALREAFSEIAACADILIGNEEDFQLCLGIPGPESGGEDLAAQIDSFKEMIAHIRETYPASVIATTLREVISANRHLWGMVVYGDGGYHVAEPREIGVIDRIGGGDGSVGGLLYGLLKGWPVEKAMQFGWATGALAVASLTDYAAPADEDQVWTIWKGNARVQR